MASRKSHPSSPVSRRPRTSISGAVQGPALARTTLSSAEDVPPAQDVPVTCGMLFGVRTELLERIDQTAGVLRAEMQQMKGELCAEIGKVNVRLDVLQADVHGLKADVHGLKADMARMLCLIEEQNARNKIALDAITSVLDRQGRTEQRMDAVEATVRDLATARKA